MVTPSSANDPYCMIELYTASKNKFSQVVSPFGKFWKTCTYGNNPIYAAATLVWECVPEFNIVRTCTMSRQWMVRQWGPVCGYGGPSVLMLSAVDGSVAAVHGPGDHPWLPHLVRGTDWWGTIGSVTVHTGCIPALRARMIDKVYYKFSINNLLKKHRNAPPSTGSSLISMSRPFRPSLLSRSLVG